MRTITLFLIEIYRLFVPSLKLIFGIQGCCRYSPSCSGYTQTVIKERGWMRGIVLGFKRLTSCHPFYP